MTEHVTVCDQAYDPSTTPKYDLHSVSSLTTYQLRQELVRLGAFERFFPPERVQYCCYDSLLEAHITLLREAKAEEEAAAKAKAAAAEETRERRSSTRGRREPDRFEAGAAPAVVGGGQGSAVRKTETERAAERLPEETRYAPIPETDMVSTSIAMSHLWNLDLSND